MLKDSIQRRQTSYKQDSSSRHLDAWSLLWICEKWCLYLTYQRTLLLDIYTLVRFSLECMIGGFKVHRFSKKFRSRLHTSMYVSNKLTFLTWWHSNIWMAKDLSRRVQYYISVGLYSKPGVYICLTFKSSFPVSHWYTACPCSSRTAGNYPWMTI